jgi:hypothetical protein
VIFEAKSCPKLTSFSLISPLPVQMRELAPQTPKIRACLVLSLHSRDLKNNMVVCVKINDIMIYYSTSVTLILLASSNTSISVADAGTYN